MGTAETPAEQSEGSFFSGECTTIYPEEHHQPYRHKGYEAENNDEQVCGSKKYELLQ
jgi:hypothetical protein